MEEIFEINLEVESASKKESRRRRSLVASEGASPVLKRASSPPASSPVQSTSGRPSLAESEDLFGESFAEADLAALDDMMLDVEKESRRTSNNKTVDRSCPKTPKFDVCSEGLSVNLARTGSRYWTPVGSRVLLNS